MEFLSIFMRKIWPVTSRVQSEHEWTLVLSLPLTSVLKTLFFLWTALELFSSSCCSCYPAHIVFEI